jgi:hypothetical protein
MGANAPMSQSEYPRELALQIYLQLKKVKKQSRVQNWLKMTK